MNQLSARNLVFYVAVLYILVTNAQDFSNNIEPTINIPIQNYETNQLTVNIELGQQETSITLLVDFTIAETWIYNTTDRHPFDCSASNTCISLNITMDLVGDYGEASGKMFSDTLKIGNTVLKNYEFGLAKKVTGNLLTAPVDGILGMGFTQTEQAFLESQLLEELFETEQIEDPVFSIKLCMPEKIGDSCNGEMMIGAYPEIDNNSEEIIYAGLDTEEFGWTSCVFGLNIAEYYYEEKEEEEVLPARISPAGGLSMIPQKQLEDIVTILNNEGAKCVSDDANQEVLRYNCQCSDDYPPIFFQFSTGWVSLTPAQYLLKQDTGNQCLLVILGEISFVEEEVVNFGTQFLAGHQIIFDLLNQEIGIVTSSTLSPPPPPLLNGQFPNIWTPAKVFGIILLIFLTVLLLTRCRRDKSRTRSSYSDRNESRISFVNDPL